MNGAHRPVSGVIYTTWAMIKRQTVNSLQLNVQIRFGKRRPTRYDSVNDTASERLAKKATTIENASVNIHDNYSLDQICSRILINVAQI